MKPKLKKEHTGFTQISNAILNDENLSLKAKGLYAFLFSKPDGWDFSGDRIALQTKDGRKSIYNTLNELEQHGYIKRSRLNTGRVQYFLCLSPNAQNGQEDKRQSAEMGSISNKDSIAIKNNSNTIAEASSAKKTKEEKDKTPMNLQQFIQWTSKSERDYIRFIGDWAETIEPQFNTLGQWNVFMRRHLRASKEIVHFDRKQIEKAYSQIKKESEDFTKFKPTIETLIKYLTK